MALSRTPEQLLKELLAHNYDGSVLSGPVFISLYRSVWKPSKLLDHVIATYNDALSLKATREACVSLLMNWVEARLLPDFFRRRSKKSKKKTLARLIEFADSLERRSHLLREFSACYALKLAIWRTWCNRRRPGQVNHGSQQKLEAAVENNGGETKSEAEKKAVAKDQKRSFLVHVWVPDPRNVALRFTTHELQMFRRVTCRELLGLTWRKQTAPHPAHAVLELISRSNNVSFWVATKIVKRKTVEKRVDMITKFIDIASACAEMHNYNTLMEILGGMNSHPVSRLKKTWEKVPQSSMEAFRTLDSVMDSKGNYRTYRAKILELRNGGQFFLPYLGVYLRDMVSLDEAMPTKRDHGINMEKYSVILNVMAELDYVVKQDLRYVSKRAQAVMRGLQDDVSETDEGLAYLGKLQGFSESELTRISRLAEPPRITASDADLVRDESVGSFSATSSHDENSSGLALGGLPSEGKSNGSSHSPSIPHNGSAAKHRALRGSGAMSSPKSTKVPAPQPSPTTSSSRSSTTDLDSTAV